MVLTFGNHYLLQFKDYIELCSITIKMEYSTDTESVSQAVLTHGKFYYPAWTHYGTPEITIICDRCHKSNIPACIGWGKYDFA